MTIDQHGPRPVHAIPADGSQNEINALVQASHTRRLTEAETARLSSLTWTPDETLERALLVIERHPDLAPNLIPMERIQTIDQHYREKRAAAAAAGRFSGQPSPALVAEVDAIAIELRDLAADPDGLAILDVRNRQAFVAALAAPDPSMDTAIRVWHQWILEHGERNRRNARRAGLLSSFGKYVEADRRNAPSFLGELLATVGGEGIDALHAIIPRG